MELKKVVTGVARKVFLNEDETTSPWVSIKRLSDAQINSIYDRNKYQPGTKTATMARFSNVVKELVQASVEDWGGFEAPGTKDPLPCTNENKLLLLEVEGIDPETGDKTNLWRILSQKLEALNEADSKN